MRLGQQLLGGIIGGVMGAAIWIALAYFTGYEVGFVAWGVGLLVGLGVASASAVRASPLAAVAAGLIAIVAVLGGKAGTAALVADEIRHELGLDGAKAKEMVISAIAEEVLEDGTAQGMVFDDEWPPGVLDDDDVRAFYAPQVWREAERRWYELTASEQMSLRGRVEHEIDASMGILFLQVFASSFGLFDVLWLVLATMSAFKIASAGMDEIRRARVPGPNSNGIPRMPGETPTGVLPIRKPEAQSSNAPLSRRGISVEQASGESGGIPSPTLPYGDGSSGTHSDTPDLRTGTHDAHKRAA